MGNLSQDDVQMLGDRFDSMETVGSGGLCAEVEFHLDLIRDVYNVVLREVKIYYKDVKEIWKWLKSKVM